MQMTETQNILETQLYEQSTNKVRGAMLLFELGDMNTKRFAENLLPTKDEEEARNHAKTVYTRLAEDGWMQKDKSTRPMTLRLNEVGRQNIQRRYDQWKQRQQVNHRIETRKEEYESLVDEITALLEDSGIGQRITEELTQGKNRCVVPIDEISKYNYDVAEKLLQEPEEAIEAYEIAAEKYTEGYSPSIVYEGVPSSCELSIGELRSKHIDKIVQFNAIVNAAGNVQPLLQAVTFQCPRCDTPRILQQTEEKLKTPRKCGECGWKGSFREIKHARTDIIRIKVKELFDEIDKQPEQILTTFTGANANKAILKQPGKRVRITGVVKQVPVRMKGGARSTTQRLIVEGLNVQPLEESFTNLEVTAEDKERIKEISQNNPLQWFKDQVFDNILGAEDIKEALTLQAFRGVKAYRGGEPVREDIHIFLVGDPGTAKTALAKQSLQLETKAGKSDGKGNSSAGLVGAAIKDEDLGEWTLQGGFLTQNNGGKAFIDEFDKMREEDRGHMYKAMDNDQVVHINKATINGYVNTKVSIVAAANPEQSSFDHSKAILPQIQLPDALLQRFDLIFAVKDHVQEDKDAAICDTMFNSRQRTPMEGRTEPDLPRKYVQYARDNHEPTLTKETQQHIKELYIEFRKYFQSKGRKVVGPRFIENVVRLTEASAKLHLRDETTQEDARLATKLMVKSLEALNEADDNLTDKFLTGHNTTTATEETIEANPVSWVRNRGGDVPYHDFVTRFDQQRLERLVQRGDLMQPNTATVTLGENAE